MDKTDIGNVEDVAREIEYNIGQIDNSLPLIKERAEEKANTIGIYYKERAKVAIRLRNGVEIEIGGEKIQNPPVSIIDMLARGKCFQEKINMEKADAFYKNAIEGIKAIEAKLNGWQSIYRHLDKICTQ